MFIDRAGAEPAAGLAPRLGTASQLGQARASAGAPALGALGARRAGQSNSSPTSDALTAAPRPRAGSGLRLGAPTLGARGCRSAATRRRGCGWRCVQLGSLRSPRCPHDASQTSRVGTACSCRTPRSVSAAAPFGHGMPRSGEAAPPPRRLRARKGPAPPQMPLRGPVSPVDGLSGPRQYRDEGPPPLGPQKGLHGLWRCPPPSVTGYAPPPSVRGVRGRARGETYDRTSVHKKHP